MGPAESSAGPVPF